MDNLILFILILIKNAIFKLIFDKFLIVINEIYK